MLFYKIEAVLTEPPKEIDSKRRRKEYAVAFGSIAEKLFADSERSIFLFISEIDDVKVTLGAALKKGVLTDKAVERFLSFNKMAAVKYEISETTVGTLRIMLCRSEREDFIENDNSVMEELEIDRVFLRFGFGTPFDEEILNNKTGFDDALIDAQHNFCAQTLVPEVERIFGGCTKKDFIGHLVQYLIEADDEETKNSAIDLLTSSLFAAGRLTGKRRTQINICNKQLLSDLYNMSESTAVVIDLSSDEDDDEYAQPINEIIKRTACEMKKHRRNVLTFICVPSGSNSLKQKLYEHLGNTAVVEIRQQPAAYEKAKEYLKNCAKNNGVRNK